MKRLIFAALFMLMSFNSHALLVTDLPIGSLFEFRKDIYLNDGQTDILIGNRKCFMNLGDPAHAGTWIPFGYRLEVSKVIFKDAIEGISPLGGHHYRTIPELKINFVNSKIEVDCRGDDILDLDTVDFETEGILEILPPNSPYFLYT